MSAEHLTVLDGGRLWMMALPPGHGATKTRLTKLAEDCPIWGWLVQCTVVDERLIYFYLKNTNFGLHCDPDSRDMVMQCLMHKAVAEVAEALHDDGVLQSTEWHRKPLQSPLLQAD